MEPKTLEFVVIKGSSKPIKPGDCMLMRSPDREKPPYVALVEEILQPPPPSRGRKGGVRVRVRWYYRPEESIRGRRRFHGSRELFLFDHLDVQSVDTIERRCFVHTFDEYTELGSVDNDDFFCILEYDSKTGEFKPELIAVFCVCEMPYNPDDLMIQCERCENWFHPSCIKMSVAKAKKVKHFICQDCELQNVKKEETYQSNSEHSEPKFLQVARKPRSKKVSRIDSWNLDG